MEYEKMKKAELIEIIFNLKKANESGNEALNKERRRFNKLEYSIKQYEGEVNEVLAGVKHLAKAGSEIRIKSICQF